MAKQINTKKAQSAPVAPQQTAPIAAPQQNVGNAVFTAFVAAQQNPVQPAPVVTLNPVTVAAVQAAVVTPVGANQAQAPATGAQALAIAAHRASGCKAGSAGGTYTPGTIGAQIAAACNALHAAGSVVSGKAVLAHMPQVWAHGVLVPLAPASASAGTSHWHAANGSLRIKGKGRGAKVAPAPAPMVQTPCALALQGQGFNALAAAGFTL